MYESILYKINNNESLINWHSFTDRSSGGSEDWAKGKRTKKSQHFFFLHRYAIYINEIIQCTQGVAGIKYSYCVELGPQDDMNTNGFIVSESNIQTAGEEVYEAVRALLRSVLLKF